MLLKLRAGYRAEDAKDAKWEMLKRRNAEKLKFLCVLCELCASTFQDRVSAFQCVSVSAFLGQ